LTEIHEIILQDGVACTLETQDRHGGGQSVDWSWAGADDAAAIILEIKAIIPTIPAPQPETLEQLARRFEPILYFHPQERFFPSDAKRYVEKCSLYRAQTPFDSKNSWGGIGEPFPRKPIPGFGANEIAAVSGEPGSLLGDGGSVGVSGEERFFELSGWKDADGLAEPFVTPATKNTYANRESVFMLYNSAVGQGGDRKLIDSKFWYHAELLDTETLRTALRKVSVPQLTIAFERLKNPALLNYYFFYPAHEETLQSTCTNTEAKEVASFAGEWSCLSILLQLDKTTGKFDPRFIGYTGHVLPGGAIVSADPMDPAARIVMRVNPFTDAKLIGEHPQLFVAKGTHSLYLDPGTITLDYPAGLVPFSCGRFEAPPPSPPSQPGFTPAFVVSVIFHYEAFLAKMIAGGSLLNPVGLGLIGAGLGTAWGVAELADAISGRPFGVGATPDQPAPDVTGAAGRAEVVKPKNVQLPADGSIYHDWQADNIEINGRRYGFLVDRTKQKWWPDDIATGGVYNGRWGPRVNNDPNHRRAGMSFPPFWRMFFMSLPPI
jgi:hypothetical protein